LGPDFLGFYRTVEVQARVALFHVFCAKSFLWSGGGALVRATILKTCKLPDERWGRPLLHSAAEPYLEWHCPVSDTLSLGKHQPLQKNVRYTKHKATTKCSSSPKEKIGCCTVLHKVVNPPLHIFQLPVKKPACLKS
jgi:hypothetical protein